MPESRISVRSCFALDTRLAPRREGYVGVLMCFLFRCTWCYWCYWCSCSCSLCRVHIPSVSSLWIQATDVGTLKCEIHVVDVIPDSQRHVLFDMVDFNVLRTPLLSCAAYHTTQRGLNVEDVLVTSIARAFPRCLCHIVMQTAAPTLSAVAIFL